MILLCLVGCRLVKQRFRRDSGYGMETVVKRCRNCPLQTGGMKGLLSTSKPPHLHSPIDLLGGRAAHSKRILRVRSPRDPSRAPWTGPDRVLKSPCLCGMGGPALIVSQLGGEYWDSLDVPLLTRCLFWSSDDCAARHDSVIVPSR